MRGSPRTCSLSANSRLGTTPMRCVTYTPGPNSLQGAYWDISGHSTGFAALKRRRIPNVAGLKHWPPPARLVTNYRIRHASREWEWQFEKGLVLTKEREVFPKFSDTPTDQIQILESLSVICYLHGSTQSSAPACGYVRLRRKNQGLRLLAILAHFIRETQYR
jgi:hypothetical protein